MSAKTNNINVTTIYFPTGIPIPWESTPAPVSVVTDKQRHEINIVEDAEDEELFYEIELANPPKKSEVEIHAEVGQLIILEKDGDGAMMIPLTMIVAIGTKGSIIQAPAVKKGFPPQNKRH